MLDVSAKTQNAIRANVARDLAPSRVVVQAKVAGSLGVGGALSLTLCGQFGVGLTPWADELHGAVMSLSTFVPCMVLCGIIFAVLPVIALRLSCRPLEFRSIMRRRPFSIVGWLLGFELLLAWHSGFSVDGLGLAAWFAASLVTIGVFGRLLDRLGYLSFGRLATS